MTERVVITSKTRETEQKRSSLYKQKSDSHSSGSTNDRILQLQRTAGNQAVQRLIKSKALQAKLKVGQPNDIYEQEADRVAEQVMRMPEPNALNEVKDAKTTAANPIQRTCPECKLKKEEEKILKAKEISGSIPEVIPELESSISFIHGGGQPLSDQVRGYFEPRFGQKFGYVRLHTDSNAVLAAQAVNARAFTVKKDIIFGTGQYKPETSEGRKLLAHELTHVVQQSDYINNNMSVIGRPPTLQRQFGGMVFDTTGSLLGRAWLQLPHEIKLRFIDRAIDAATASIDKFPGKAILGSMWIFIKEGLIGFYQSLKSAEEKVKITVMDKIVRIISGQSFEYAKGLLLGLLKGFFCDGLLGIFIAIWELIKGLKHLWGFFKHVGELIMGFPEELAKLVINFENLSLELLNETDPIAEIRRLVTDPKQTIEFASRIVEQGKSFSKEAGQKVAESLLSFFSKPGAEAEIGKTVGRGVGMILFEVIFAIVTAGGGTAMTGLKSAATYLSKLIGRIAGSVLKVFRELHEIFDAVIDVVKGAAEFLKESILGKLAEKFRGLLSDIKNFIKRILGSCHESKLICPWKPGEISKILSKRPHWRQSEEFVENHLGSGWKPQTSFFESKKVPLSKYGSVRPDFYNRKLNIAAEVKNYNLSTEYKDLISILKEQGGGRMAYMPVRGGRPVRQWLFLDLRGQQIADLAEMAARIQRDTGGSRIFELIHFITEKGILKFKP